jgi:hypothetical protein
MGWPAAGYCVVTVGHGGDCVAATGVSVAGKSVLAHLDRSIAIASLCGVSVTVILRYHVVKPTALCNRSFRLINCFSHTCQADAMVIPACHSARPMHGRRWHAQDDMLEKFASIAGQIQPKNSTFQYASV